MIGTVHRRPRHPLPPPPPPQCVERLSRVSYDLLYYNDSIVSATSAFASVQVANNGDQKRETSASDCSSPAIAANTTQYLAESPFSCQTSIVPVTRNQFYLVVQINMNNGAVNGDDNEQAERPKEGGEGERAESPEEEEEEEEEEAVLEREKTEEGGGEEDGKTGFAQVPGAAAAAQPSLSLLPLSFSASGSSVSSLPPLPPPPPPPPLKMRRQ